MIEDTSMAGRQPVSQSRGEVWRGVWTERDDDLADWNGYEKTVESLGTYESLTSAIGELVRARLRLTQDDVVADLGCGTGRVSNELAPHVRRVIAFDYSETVLRVAKARRTSDNIEYAWADLNDFDVENGRYNKAFAASSFLYLDSEEAAVSLISRFHERGIDLLVLDIPDKNLKDTRPREYDTSTFTHLAIDPDELVRRFPMAEVTRGEMPGYVNAAFRFNFFCPGSSV